MMLIILKKISETCHFDSVVSSINIIYTRENDLKSLVSTGLISSGLLSLFLIDTLLCYMDTDRNY